jgi:hypothetical protein
VYEKYPYLLAEMYAYSMAAAHERLPHLQLDNYMVSSSDAGGEGWPHVDSLDQVCVSPSDKGTHLSVCMLFLRCVNVHGFTVSPPALYVTSKLIHTSIALFNMLYCGVLIYLCVNIFIFTYCLMCLCVSSCRHILRRTTHAQCDTLLPGVPRRGAGLYEAQSSAQYLLL